MFDQRNPSFQLMSRSKWEKDLSIQSHSIQYCMTNTITTTSTAKSRRNILLFSQQMAHSESYSLDYIICGSSKGTFGVQEELIRHYSWNRNYQIWSWSIFIITFFFRGRGQKWNMALQIICIGPRCHRNIAWRFSILLHHIFVLRRWELNVAFTKAIKLCFTALLQTKQTEQWAAYRPLKTSTSKENSINSCPRYQMFIMQNLW